MKNILITILFISAVPSYAQTFDDIIEKNRYINCEDVAFNAFPLIKKFYSNDQIDSMYLFLDYWESKCGFMESTFRLRNILDIKTGQFIPDSISKYYIEDLIRYGNSSYYFGNNHIFHHNYFYFPPFRIKRDYQIQQQQLDSLIQQIALGTESDNVDELLILDFYSRKYPDFTKIKAAPESSRLKRLHQEIYEETLRQSEFHFAAVTGVIQPYHNISIFGTRPTIGFVAGFKKLRHNYDAVFDFRIGPSKHDYTFLYKDSLFTDDKFTGVYIGLEYTFDFVTSKKLDIGLSPGFGYDGFTALEANNDLGEDSKDISSFNKNAGLVFKYKIGANGEYIGLHLRYNWVDYKNPGGTELDGEYFNIRITVGVINNVWRSNKLESLK